MNLQQRISSLVQLGAHMAGNNEEWMAVREKASRANGWFTPEFIDLAAGNIVRQFLQETTLTRFAAQYAVGDSPTNPRTVGIVMAGNIPLVGFHDWLCTYLTGHKAVVKPSSKDDILFRHLIGVLGQIEPKSTPYTLFTDVLKGADAYIATGSNNSGRYFDYYFARFPHIIRRNRSSAALLTRKESREELDRLADDIHLYFGMGCRNVTRLYVPEGYDFVPLLESFEKYRYFFDHPKFRSNYDYQLAIRILNKEFYMTRDTMILVENPSLFAPVSVVHYTHYSDPEAVKEELRQNSDLQCLTGTPEFPFGIAQEPRISDFADGVDTMKFLQEL